MDKVAGRFVKLYTGPNAAPVVVNCLTEIGLSLSKEEIDVTCSSNTTGWSASIGGFKKGTLTASGYIVTNPTNGDQQLFDAFDNDTVIEWKMTSEQSGTAFKSGSGIIVAYNEKGAVNGAMTFDITISITSPVISTPIA